MYIDNTPIKSLVDYVDRMSKYNGHAIYRGVTKESYELIPSLGRNYAGNYEKAVEIGRLLISRFKRFSTPYLEHMPEDIDDYKWLIIAQHYGVPTKLLDWTMSPLVALYFSCCRYSDTENGAIYVTRDPCLVNGMASTGPYTGIRKFAPDHYSERVTAQGSVFTKHEDPTIAMDGDDIDKYIVPKELKDTLLISLNQHNINYMTLFPGLDGISEHLCWEENNRSKLPQQTYGPR